MKLIIASTLMICLSLAATAQCTSTLVVHNYASLPVKVYVDGQTGHNPPTAGVTVNGLTPGQHQLKVIAIYTDEYGERRKRSLFSGNIRVRSGYYMEGTVDENHGLSMHETKQQCDGDDQQTYPVPNTSAPNNYNNDYASSNGQRNESQDYNVNPNDANANQRNTYAATPADNIPPHISDAEFDQLKAAINTPKYETKKMDTLKTLVTPYQFTTAQVGVLMSLFAFESNKLDVAKLLYNSCVDKKNYGTLASNFNFDARKEDFRKFMQGK